MDYKFFKDDKQVSEVILPSWIMSFFMRERILNKDNYVFRIGAFYNGNNISDMYEIAKSVISGNANRLQLIIDGKCIVDFYFHQYTIKVGVDASYILFYEEV